MSFLFLKIFYLLIFREGEGGRKRGRETSTCGGLLHAPYQELGPQPRQVPKTGNQTSDPFVCKPHQPGLSMSFINLITGFFSLCIIPLYGGTQVCLSIHLSWGISVDSMLGHSFIHSFIHSFFSFYKHSCVGSCMDMKFSTHNT